MGTLGHQGDSDDGAELSDECTQNTGLKPCYSEATPMAHGMVLQKQTRLANILQASRRLSMQVCVCSHFHDMTASHHTGKTRSRARSQHIVGASTSTSRPADGCVESFKLERSYRPTHQVCECAERKATVPKTQVYPLSAFQRSLCAAAKLPSFLITAQDFSAAAELSLKQVHNVAEAMGRCSSQQHMQHHDSPQHAQQHGRGGEQMRR